MNSRPFILLLTLCMLVFAGPAYSVQAANAPAGIPAMTTAEMGGKYDPAKIPLLGGRVTLPEFDAEIDVPQDMGFISTADARRFARVASEGVKDDFAHIAGYIVSKDINPAYANGAKRPVYLLPYKWQIPVVYVPTYVSPEDVLSTDYDDIIRQVRETHRQIELAQSVDGYNPNAAHVMGWAVMPDYDNKNDTMIWALNIMRNNAPDHSVPITAVKMGRRGYFKLTHFGRFADIRAEQDIIQRAAAALSFDADASWQLANNMRLKAGWRHAYAGSKFDWEDTTTLGTLIAEDLNARRATPLTWPEYFGTLVDWLIKIFLHYLVEILVAVTIGLLLVGYSYLRRRFQPDYGYYDDDDYDDEEYDEDDIGPWDKAGKEGPYRTYIRPEPKPAAPIMLNGKPIG
jgi:hypothetical protein